MIKEAVLITLLSNFPHIKSVAETETLAPHPITFSQDGSPAHEIIYIEEDDTYYDIYWDGKSLHAPVEIYKKSDVQKAIMYILLASGSLLMWYFIIYWLIRKFL